MSTLSVSNITGLSSIDVDELTVNDSPIPIADAGSLSLRNKIINGNFDIWQRGTSTTSGFATDRWGDFSGGSTIVASRQAFTVGQTDVPNEPTYFHRTVVTSVAGASNYAIMRQLIEGVRTFAGQTVTLSFWAKADASKNMAVDLLQSFGTGGSPSSGVEGTGVTTCALTTSWQKFTITASMPSISGKTLGTNGDDYIGVRMWFDAGSDFNSLNNSLGQQSGTFDIAQVQLEAGSVATPFEMRPIGQELALCQRYCEISRGGGVAYSSSAAAIQRFWLPFLTEKRAVPSTSLTVISGTGTSPSSSVTYVDGIYVAFASTGSSIAIIVQATVDAEL